MRLETAFTLFTFSVLFSFCSSSIEYSKTNKVITEVNTIVRPGYATMKRNVDSLRIALSDKKKDKNFIEQNFVSVIADSIIPYWYGTSWDFNGTTQNPGEGSIACGYFVSTVLRDAGLKIERVKMGQSASEYMIHKLASAADTKTFYKARLTDALSFVKNKGFGIYIIGLDCHVGFLYNDSVHIWFIHSKWYKERAVVKEDAYESEILKSSSYRMIGKISNNNNVLNNWLQKKCF